MTVAAPAPGPSERIGRLLAQVASWMLPGAAGIEPVREPAEALRLIEHVEGERLLGPLLLAVDSGAVDLRERALDELVERHRQALTWSIHLESRLLEVRSWFASAGGIEHLVLKGPAVAHLDEVDPSLRSFADVDLLVAGRDLDRAVAVLTRHGATRPWAERRPGFDRRFTKSVTMTLPDGAELDLHRSLCDGAHGFRIPLDRLFAQPDAFDLGGEQVPALAPVHRLLHAAYHAVLGSPEPRLASLRDLAGYLSTEALGPEVVVPEVACWRGEAVLSTAVELVFDRFDLDLPAWRSWAQETDVPASEAAVRDRQRREGSAIGRAKVDALRELTGLCQRASYARALLWPTTAHLRSRGLTRQDHLRSALTH